MNHYVSRLKILLSFALRDVSKSRIILVFTIMSLSAAFTAVFVSAGVLDGFQAMLERGSIDTGGELTIKAKTGNGGIENIDDVTRILGAEKNIAGYSVRSYGGLKAKMDGKYKGHGYAAIGVDPMQEREATQIPDRVIAGRYLLPGDTRSVVVGITMADSLKGLLYDNQEVHVGDKIRFIGPSNNKGRDYTIVGIASTKYFHPDWSTYFPKKEIEWLDNTREDSEIIVKLKDPAQMDETKKKLQRLLPYAEVFNWKEREGYIFNIVTMVNFITSTISNLLIITTFVIMSVIIFINVHQRRRQIAILKSMGASSRFVVAIYVVQTLTYSLFSFALAYLTFLLMHSFSLNHPIPMQIGDFHTVVVDKSMAQMFGILFLASLVGSLFPSYMAARTRIVDVLRNTV
ncbi:MAG: ABC transporter permease [Candidatus Moraniibacteriota bacterium]